MGLTRLSKCVELWLTYIVLYLYLDTTWFWQGTLYWQFLTQFANRTWTQYKISELWLMGLTCLIKWVELGLIYIVLYPYFKTIQIWHTNMLLNLNKRTHLIIGFHGFPMQLYIPLSLSLSFPPVPTFVLEAVACTKAYLIKNRRVKTLRGLIYMYLWKKPKINIFAEKRKIAVAERSEGLFIAQAFSSFRIIQSLNSCRLEVFI
jgi:hypothetical protein